MAADDDHGTAPEPGDETGAADAGEDGGEISFRFEEPADAADVSGWADADDPVAAEAAADAEVDDWLSGDDGADQAPVPPLTVFTSDDAAAGSSSIEIGTGRSGIGLHGDLEHDAIGTDTFAGIVGNADEPSGAWAAGGTDVVGGDDDGTDDPGSFDMTAGVATGVAAAATGGSSPRPVVRRPTKPAKKTSAIGQLIGIVMGGLLAIPITLAILIYGLGKDPFGITKKVPDEVAFLLPAKFRPGFKKPVAAPNAADEPGGSALDSLPTVAAPVEPVPEPSEPVDEPAAAGPVDVADESGDMPPDSAPEPDVVAVDPPGLDDLVVNPAPAPEAAPTPPPLDTALLDEAMAEAAALGEALGAVDDRQNGAYKKLRTRWYRALARVAAELVAVEDAATTSGRALADTPDKVASLHGAVAGREALVAELAALAPDWLAYSKRGSDGVVLPVTFASARRVGPYWTMRATLTGADGQPKELTVISRNEPVAIEGDRIVVTGVALEESVIWAADVRGLGGEGVPPGF